jgi:hypothetical protein
MKHADDETLDAIEPVLLHLRRLEGIREKKRGLFYRKSQAFLHFHADPRGIFADVRGDTGWLRYRVSTRAERRQFLQMIKTLLPYDSRLYRAAPIRTCRKS